MSEQDMTTEYAVFHKRASNNDEPLERFTFKTSESAERFIEGWNDGHEWLEVRTRAVTEWQVAA